MGPGGSERRPVVSLRLLRRRKLRLEERQLGADGDQFAIGLFALSQAAVRLVEPRLKLCLGVALAGQRLLRGREGFLQRRQRRRIGARRCGGGGERLLRLGEFGGKLVGLGGARGLRGTGLALGLFGGAPGGGEFGLRPAQVVAKFI